VPAGVRKHSALSESTALDACLNSSERSKAVYNAGRLEGRLEAFWIRGDPMKRISLILACVVCLSAAVWAQDEADYHKWMQDVNATSGMLNKALMAKSPDAVVAAKKLADLFGQVHAFWQKKGEDGDDAAKYAADAQTAFKQAADSAAAGKFDEAADAYGMATRNCAGCHAVHRLRDPDGTYEIK
jgi:cytochrome c556